MMAIKGNINILGQKGFLEDVLIRKVISRNILLDLFLNHIVKALSYFWQMYFCPAQTTDLDTKERILNKATQVLLPVQLSSL